MFVNITSPFAATQRKISPAQAASLNAMTRQKMMILPRMIRKPEFYGLPLAAEQNHSSAVLPGVSCALGHRL